MNRFLFPTLTTLTSALLTSSLVLSGCSNTKPSTEFVPLAAVQRPLSDFIDAQGTTQCFTPPAPDQIGWASDTDLEPVRFAMIDYDGKTAELLGGYGIELGTTVSGSVTERPLADGRAEVTVNLHTKKTLAWAVDYDLSQPLSQFNTNPLLFGVRAQDLIANPNATPALGTVHLHVVFKNTAPGAPLPDLVSLASGPDCPDLALLPPGFELETLSINGSFSGPLHADAGLGPDGTPGNLIVTQTGLIRTAINNEFKGALSDAFPAERVELRRLGK